VEAWFLHLAGQWSRIAPHPSRQLLHYNKHFKNKNDQCLNIFVTVDKHQGFISLTVERHLSGLDIRPATLKIRLLIISILLTISSKCGLRSNPAKYCAAFN